LIHQEIPCVACFLGSAGGIGTGLSQPALDNLVDNFRQVLYGVAKPLICKEIHRNAHFLGNIQAQTRWHAALLF
jgi:hypothetical protein